MSRYPKGTVLRGKGIPSRRECLKSAHLGYPCNPELFTHIYRYRGALVPIKQLVHFSLPAEPQWLNGRASKILPIVGLLTPIGLRLVDGSHRLSAILRAGRKLIRAVIVEPKRKEIENHA